MYYVKKTFEVAAAHRLSLSYPSRCQNLHGHNWMITVYCKSDVLNDNGMVVDFGKIKEIVHGRLDHENINEAIPGMNPTAEHIARWIVKNVPFCYRADVQESANNIASYEV